MRIKGKFLWKPQQKTHFTHDAHPLHDFIIKTTQFTYVYTQQISNNCWIPLAIYILHGYEPIFQLS